MEGLGKIILGVITAILLTFVWGLVGNTFNSNLLFIIQNVKKYLYGYIDPLRLMIIIMAIIAITYKLLRDSD